MSENNKAENEETKQNINPEEESIEATGQIILGEIEKIGGILTANPTAQAEGEFNIEAGNLRKEIAEDLAQNDSTEEE